MPLIAAQLVLSSMPAPLWWLLAVWMFALGASIGSFMNVVIYRLPAGLSLVHPGSRCPKCKTPLAARDNVPIFGWLWLRGRCRYCSLPISPRYPAVELFMACTFMLLACLGPLAGGANLPGFADRAAEASAGNFLLWGVYAYHLFLLCGLVCAALMKFDGHAMPSGLLIPLLLVGWAAPLFWPELHPVPSGVLSRSTLLNFPWAAGLVDGAAGFAAGTTAGWLAAWRCSRQSGKFVGRSSRDVALALGCVGLFLGWQAAAVLAATTTTMLFGLTLIGRVWPPARRAGLIACLAPLTLAWLAVWGPIASQCDFLASGANVGTFVAAATAVVAFAWLRGKLKIQK
ncbi:MAG TPA: prepilin peptidase [Pirellulales bacterium]|nr:prepilin peptidase [Pirellulales bacterium]